jgi:hypothetical protein
MSRSGQKALKQLQQPQQGKNKTSLLSQIKGLCAQCGLVYVSIAAILGAATLVPTQQAVQEEKAPHHCHRSPSQAVDIDLSLGGGASQEAKISQLILSFDGDKLQKSQARQTPLSWTKLQDELNEALNPSSSKMDEEKNETEMDEETTSEGGQGSQTSPLPSVKLIETLGQLPIVLTQLSPAVDAQTAKRLVKKLEQFRTPDDTKGLLCSGLSSVEVNRQLVLAARGAKPGQWGIESPDWHLPPASNPTYPLPFRGDGAYSIHEGSIGGSNGKNRQYRYLEIPNAANGYPWFARASNQYDGLDDAKGYGLYAYTEKVHQKVTSAPYYQENLSGLLGQGQGKGKQGTGGVIEGWRLITSGQEQSPNQGLGDVRVAVIDGPLLEVAIDQGYIPINKGGWAFKDSGLDDAEVEPGDVVAQILQEQTLANDSQGRGPRFWVSTQTYQDGNDEFKHRVNHALGVAGLIGAASGLVGTSGSGWIDRGRANGPYLHMNHLATGPNLWSNLGAIYCASGGAASASYVWHTSMPVEHQGRLDECVGHLNTGENPLDLIHLSHVDYTATPAKAGDLTCSPAVQATLNARRHHVLIVNPAGNVASQMNRFAACTNPGGVQKINTGSRKSAQDLNRAILMVSGYEVIDHRNPEGGGLPRELQGSKLVPDWLSPLGIGIGKFIGVTNFIAFAPIRQVVLHWNDQEMAHQQASGTSYSAAYITGMLAAYVGHHKASNPVFRLRADSAQEADDPQNLTRVLLKKAERQGLGFSRITLSNGKGSEGGKAGDLHVGTYPILNLERLMKQTRPAEAGGQPEEEGDDGDEGKVKEEHFSPEELPRPGSQLNEGE